MAEDGLDVGAEEGKKGGKKKLIIIILAALILLGGGGAAAYLFLFSGGDDAEASEDGAPATEQMVQTEGPAIYLELEQPFVADFMVSGRQRYLQLNMTLKSRDQGQIDAVKLHMPLIRNSLVLLFSSQSFDELQTLEGKQQLKASSVEVINKILTEETGMGGIEDVLFTNFVMQ